MGLSETILAAMIGALATLVTAIFQLTLTWRDARRAHQPGGGVRSLVWVLALMAAAGVGGFTYAEYRRQGSRNDVQLLREELQQQLRALSVSTAHPQRLGTNGSESDQAHAEQRGLEGVSALVTLPACSGPQVGFAIQRASCTEQDALQVTLCAPVPTAARVTAVELFARPEDSQQSWTQAQVAAGQDLGGGRFGTSHFERAEADGIRHVCQLFVHWDSRMGRSVRILVRYQT